MFTQGVSIPPSRMPLAGCRLQWQTGAWIPAFAGMTGNAFALLPVPVIASYIPGIGYNRGTMLVRDIGEFGVIERLNRMVVGRGAGNEAVRAFPLLVDTGDDTAAWQTGEALELFTTDTMVEGVHFTRETTPWRELGWKAIAANISDVASMGGLPTYALITLGLPSETAVSDIEEMYRGMLEIGEEYGMGVVGGDIVRSPVFFVTTALTGVTRRPPLLRSNARPGDAVAVTGWLGSSAGGLRLMLDPGLAEGPDATGKAAEFLREAHRKPAPAVEAGQILSQMGIETAMDVSDGLVDDLSKLCAASGVSARVNASAVPAHPLLRQQFPGEFLSLALGGGEDYVLLFTGPPEVVYSLMPRLGEGSAVIGAVAPPEELGGPGRVAVMDDAGRELSLSGGGWDHFA